MKLERGEVSAEAALVVPVVFAVLLMGVQASILFHTTTVATASAAQGAAAAAAAGGSAVLGEKVATVTAVELGGRLTVTPHVEVLESSVAVSVRLDVPHVIPGFPTAVERKVVEARERFVDEDDR
jgi:hypothetical protein